jgi:TRAP-type C4-dicarboxylate transport system permease small subunit
MVRSLGQKIQFVTAYIVKITSNISTAVIILMMFLTLVDVTLRKFGSGIPGAFELNGLMLVVITFFALAHCWNQDGHIRVDMFLHRFPLRARSTANSCTALVGLLFFGAVMLGGAKFAIRAFVKNEISITLNLPLFPVKLLLVVGCALFCFQLLLSFIVCMSECFKKIRDMKGQ